LPHFIFKIRKYALLLPHNSEVIGSFLKKKNPFNFKDGMIYSTPKKQVEKENPKGNVYYSVVSLASICKRTLHL